ncbi:MAG: sulfur carrier protein ThiS adenylyltransferase ThiF [Anaerosomatales bacterium]
MPADDNIGCPPPFVPSDDPAMRARLAASHVAIIGCGGLGSNAAAMLLRSGVGHLTLIDFDVVEKGNLNRQLFFHDQIGMRKTDALAETLRRIDPGAALTLVHECMTPENLLATVGAADVVIEAVDRAEVKAMITNVLCGAAPELPLVGASGLAGVRSANDVVTEQIGEHFYLIGDCTSDVRDGLPLLASRVMVAAAHQAHAAIRILLGHAEP